MQFANPIIGEEELIRSAIKSRDYEAGISGWRIARDGSAEFSDLTVRSSDGSGNSIELNNGEISITDNADNLLAAVQFSTDGGAAGFWTRDFEAPRNTYAYLAGGELELGTVIETEDSPATISFSSTGFPALTNVALTLFGPRATFGASRATIELIGYSDGTSKLTLSADVVTNTSQVFGSVVITPVVDTPTSTTVVGLDVSGVNFKGYCTVNSSALNVIKEVSVSNVTSTGLMVWIHSSSTTNRTVNWMVVGHE